MCKLEEIDKNFKKVSLDGYELVFHNSKEKPFSITGICVDPDLGDGLFRIPNICGVNGGALWLSKNTAGVKVRFSTDSPYIAIYAEIGDACHMSHMPLTGSCGFDLYRLYDNEEKFVGTFIPPTGIVHGQKHYHSIIRLSDSPTEKAYYTVYLPLYNNVEKLDIGIAPNASLDKGADFTCKKPIVYYGSSITQGGCASRPGNAYPALITHRLNIDHTNLGFSGSCVGEAEFADHIGSLPMCAFVYDYDYNAPTPEHLEKTHEPFFKIIRKKQMSLPIIILSAPYNAKSSDDRQRRDIIKRTYENAIANGDRNVYFIDGGNIFEGIFSDCCTVDGVHPNDMGFLRMAEKLLPIIEKALNI